MSDDKDKPDEPLFDLGSLKDVMAKLDLQKAGWRGNRSRCIACGGSKKRGEKCPTCGNKSDSRSSATLKSLRYRPVGRTVKDETTDPMYKDSGIHVIDPAALSQEQIDDILARAPEEEKMYGKVPGAFRKQMARLNQYWKHRTFKYCFSCSTFKVLYERDKSGELKRFRVLREVEKTRSDGVKEIREVWIDEFRPVMRDVKRSVVGPDGRKYVQLVRVPALELDDNDRPILESGGGRYDTYISRDLKATKGRVLWCYQCGAKNNRVDPYFFISIAKKAANLGISPSELLKQQIGGYFVPKMDEKQAEMLDQIGLLRERAVLHVISRNPTGDIMRIVVQVRKIFLSRDQVIAEVPDKKGPIIRTKRDGSVVRFRPVMLSEMVDPQMVSVAIRALIEDGKVFVDPLGDWRKK